MGWRGGPEPARTPGAARAARQARLGVGGRAAGGAGRPAIPGPHVLRRPRPGAARRCGAGLGVDALLRAHALSLAGGGGVLRRGRLYDGAHRRPDGPGRLDRGRRRGGRAALAARRSARPSPARPLLRHPHVRAERAGSPHGHLVRVERHRHGGARPRPAHRAADDLLGTARHRGALGRGRDARASLAVGPGADGDRRRRGAGRGAGRASDRREGRGVRAVGGAHGRHRRGHRAALDVHRSPHRLQPAHLVPGHHHGAARRREPSGRAGGGGGRPGAALRALSPAVPLRLHDRPRRRADPRRPRPAPRHHGLALGGAHRGARPTLALGPGPEDSPEVCDAATASALRQRRVAGRPGGPHVPRRQSGHRRDLHADPRGRRRDRAPGGGGGRASAGRVGRAAAGGARRSRAQGRADLGAAERGSAAHPHHRDRRGAGQGGIRGRLLHRADPPGRRAHVPGERRGGALQRVRQDQLLPAQAGRRRVRRLAVELSLHPHAARRGAGAGAGQRRGPQALRGDAAGRRAAGGRGLRGGRDSARRAQRDHLRARATSRRWATSWSRIPPWAW